MCNDYSFRSRQPCWQSKPNAVDLKGITFRSLRFLFLLNDISDWANRWNLRIGDQHEHCFRQYLLSWWLASIFSFQVELCFNSFSIHCMIINILSFNFLVLYPSFCVFYTTLILSLFSILSFSLLSSLLPLLSSLLPLLYSSFHFLALMMFFNRRHVFSQMLAEPKGKILESKNETTLFCLDSCSFRDIGGDKKLSQFDE